MDQETADYIISFYTRLFTPIERRAHMHRIYIQKASSISRMKMMLERGWLVNDKEARALLADGNEAFNMRVAERIMREIPEKVFLNRCAQCGQLARTPMARQCRCGHQWHDKTA